MGVQSDTKRQPRASESMQFNSFILIIYFIFLQEELDLGGTTAHLLIDRVW